MLGIGLNDANFVMDPGPAGADGLRQFDRVLSVDGHTLGNHRLVQRAVETAAFVAARPLASGAPRGGHWLWAALHAPEDPLSPWACFQRL